MKNGGLAAALVAGAAVMLAACGGGSLCDHANDAYNNLNKKVGNCQVSGLPVTFNKNTCDQNVKNCSSAEQDAMQRYFDCINAIATCQAGGETAWTNAVNNCQANITISQACATAVNPQ